MSWLTVWDGQSYQQLPYLGPKDFVTFLLERTPELVTGGFLNMAQGKKNLESFWCAYKVAHPEHTMFQEAGHEDRYSRTLAMCFHGDEGRGLKKSNTCVLMLETCLGMQTASQGRKRRVPASGCDQCCVAETFAKRFRTSTGYVSTPAPHPCDPLRAEQVTNLRQNSFLTKYVLCALPSVLYKSGGVLEAILTVIFNELQELAVNGITVGGTQWWVQLTGCKGDLDWFKKEGNLTRCWKSQIGAGLMMCHECAAGGPNAPFEDVQHEPSWAQTRWFARPWEVEPLITRLVFEEDRPEPVMRRDVFHNTKTGIFRDFVGSTVLLLCRFGYFHLNGESYKREVLLQRAHTHFSLWCLTQGKSAGLRSFTPTFFNAPDHNSFGWVNCKGSDSMLLLAWLKTLLVGLKNDLLNPSHAETLDIMLRGATHAIDFTNMMYDHNLWLPRHCAAKLYSDIHLFLTAYRALAFLSLHKWHFTGFAMKSKLHMIAHTKHDLLEWLSDPFVHWIPNPQIWGCEMNEDVVGKVSRLSRRVSTRLPQRTLELYLIKCKAVHRRFVAGLKAQT